MMTTTQRLANYFLAGYPAVALTTTEEVRAMRDVFDATVLANKGRATQRAAVKVATWSATEGVRIYVVNNQDKPTTLNKVGDTEDLLAACRSLANDEIQGMTIILRDSHQWPFERDPILARAFRDLVSGAPDRGCTIVLISPDFKLWTAVEKLVTVMEYSLPDAAAIKSIAEGIAAAAGTKKKLTIDEQVIKACAGLSTTEVENALALSFIESKDFDPAIIYREKVSAVKRSGLLEIVDPDPRGLDAIGGLDNLKDWILRRKSAYSPEAEKYGLPSPKGCLLVGVPGTGKSLSAKAIGTALGVPALKLDIGALFNSLVGESESRTREALKLAEAMSPCVTGDTEIELADGRVVTALELFENNVKGVQCKAFDETSKKPVASSLLAVIKKQPGEHGIFKITTQVGSIKVTGNHKLMTDSGWKEANQLTLTDKIFYPAGNRITRHKLTLTFPLRKYARYARRSKCQTINSLESIEGGFTYAVGRGGFADSVCKNLPSQMTEEVADLLGFILSDGWFEQRSFSFTNSNEKLIQHFCTLCNNIFGIAPTVRKNGYPGRTTTKKSGENITTRKQNYVCRVTNKLATKFMKMVFDQMLGLDDIYLQRCLGTFFEGDGSIDIKQSKIVFTQIKHQSFVINALRRLNVFVGCQKDGKHIEVTGNKTVKRLACLLGLKETFPSVKYDAPRGVKKTVGGLYIRIKSLSSEPNEDVFDLSLNKPNTYVSNGMLSHNCVLWVDEVDKGLAGAGGSGSGDSGTSRRVFGTILNWMQERKAQVFVVMTANQVDQLPPEFLRRGRFDELFAIDLPTASEREKVAAVVLRKSNRNPESFNLTAIAAATNQYTGAEIEATVQEAMFAGYEQKREFNTDDICQAAAAVIPIAKTMAEKIDSIRKWSDGRARQASKSEAPETMVGRKLSVK